MLHHLQQPRHTYIHTYTPTHTRLMSNKLGLVIISKLTNLKVTHEFTNSILCWLLCWV